MLGISSVVMATRSRELGTNHCGRKPVDLTLSKARCHGNLSANRKLRFLDCVNSVFVSIIFGWLWREGIFFLHLYLTLVCSIEESDSRAAGDGCTDVPVSMALGGVLSGRVGKRSN